jgi:hypothetical protein
MPFYSGIAFLYFFFHIEVRIGPDKHLVSQGYYDPGHSYGQREFKQAHYHSCVEHFSSGCISSLPPIK